MPLYTVTTQGGSLSNEAKVELAAKLTALHCEMSGVPKNWIHVVFHDYTAGSGFTAGEPCSDGGACVAHSHGPPIGIQTRVAEASLGVAPERHRAPDDQIVIGIQEVPASQAMEMGEIMPDVAGHSAPSD